MSPCAIVACEVGFWVVLATGLVARYPLRRPRLGAALLAGVPLVDLALLVFTVLDLRRGAEPSTAHGLAAVYLGFSVVFGPALVRWADVRFAHRFAGGPPPAGKPAGGTAERVRWEWREFGRAGLAAGISTVLLLAAAALVDEPAALLWWIARLGLVLAIWLATGPLVESVRAVRSAG